MLAIRLADRAGHHLTLTVEEEDTGAAIRLTSGGPRAGVDEWEL